jgi:hypothetical protein
MQILHGGRQPSLFAKPTDPPPEKVAQYQLMHHLDEYQADLHWRSIPVLTAPTSSRDMNDMDVVSQEQFLEDDEEEEDQDYHPSTTGQKQNKQTHMKMAPNKRHQINKHHSANIDTIGIHLEPGSTSPIQILMKNGKGG